MGERREGGGCHPLGDAAGRVPEGEGQVATNKSYLRRLVDLWVWGKEGMGGLSLSFKG